MIEQTKKLALLAGVLVFAGACADSRETEPVAYETTDSPAMAQETTEIAPAVVIDRTAVAVVGVDTNGTNNASSIGGPASNSTGSGSQETNKVENTSTNLDASGAAGGSQIGQGASSSRQSAGGSSTPQKQAQSQNQRLIDHTVLDRSGQKVGTVEELWENEQGQPVYLAVKRAEGNEMFVVPAELAQSSQQRNAIRVPYAKDTLQAAPKFERESELDAQAEQRIKAFYQERDPQVTALESQRQQQRQQLRQQQQSSHQQQASAGGQNRTEQDEATIQLKEERLKVGKRQVEAGGVVLRKVVRTETVNQPVTLRREELVIERQPGSGQPVEGNAQFAEREIFIPLVREEPVIQKEVLVKEVVNVGKKAEEQQRQISEQVREEELEIQRQGLARENAAGGAASAQSGSRAQGQSSQSQQTNSNQQPRQSQPEK